MNAVVQPNGVYLEMIEEVQNKMLKMKEHNLTPKFVKMSAQAYWRLRIALHDKTIYGATKDEIMGLPIVICDGINGIDVVPSADDMLKNGLL